MRSERKSMNPEQLEAYDPDGTADAQLRAAIKDADGMAFRAKYKLVTGQPWSESATKVARRN